MLLLPKTVAFSLTAKPQKSPPPLWGRVRVGGPSQAIEGQQKRSEHSDAARPSFHHPRAGVRQSPPPRTNRRCITGSLSLGERAGRGFSQGDTCCTAAMQIAMTSDSNHRETQGKPQTPLHYHIRGHDPFKAWIIDLAFRVLDHPVKLFCRADCQRQASTMDHDLRKIRCQIDIHRADNDGEEPER